MNTKQKKRVENDVLEIATIASAAGRGETADAFILLGLIERLSLEALERIELLNRALRH